MRKRPGSCEGALLLDDRDAFFPGSDAPEVPWSDTRPRSVGEIPPFDDPFEDIGELSKTEPDFDLGFDFPEF